MCRECAPETNDMSDDTEEELTLEEDDILTSDHKTFYQGRKKIFTLKEGDDMWKELDEHMTATNFFPNVWFVSDHGNPHLMSREE